MARGTDGRRARRECAAEAAACRAPSDSCAQAASPHDGRRRRVRRVDTQTVERASPARCPRSTAVSVLVLLRVSQRTPAASRPGPSTSSPYELKSPTTRTPHTNDDAGPRFGRRLRAAAGPATTNRLRPHPKSRSRHPFSRSPSPHAPATRSYRVCPRRLAPHVRRSPQEPSSAPRQKETEPCS